MCHSVLWKVREKHIGVSFFFLLGHRNWIQVFRLCSNHLLPTEPYHSAVLLSSSIPLQLLRNQSFYHSCLSALPLPLSSIRLLCHLCSLVLWLLSCCSCCYFVDFTTGAPLLCLLLEVGKKPPAEKSLLLGLKWQQQGMQCKGTDPCQLNNWAASF